MSACWACSAGVRACPWGARLVLLAAATPRRTPILTPPPYPHRATLPESNMAGYRNGVIMVGLARCIAMVLLWNQLARGNAEYCAIMVALNSGEWRGLAASALHPLALPLPRPRGPPPHPSRTHTHTQPPPLCPPTPPLTVFQIILYAPLALFYISVVSGQDMAGIDFWDVARSVLIFLGAPLVAGIITRYTVIWLAGREWFENK